MGAAAVFPPGTVIADSALVLLERMGMEIDAADAD
jgi:methylmalonyl-CoA mutase